MPTWVGDTQPQFQDLFPDKCVENVTPPRKTINKGPHQGPDGPSLEAGLPLHSCPRGMGAAPRGQT